MKLATFFLNWLVFIPSLNVFLGVFIMTQCGIARRIWGQNIGAWILGMITWLLISVWNPKLSCRGLALFTYLVPVFIALTFFDRRLGGVHRWTSIGPLHIHVASIVLPAFLIAFRRIALERAAWGFAVLIASLLAFQPDASEASGFAAGMFLLLLRGRMKLVERLITASLLIASIILAWANRDPLLSVPHVEGIIAIAGTIHPLLAVACVISIAMLPLPFLLPLLCDLNTERDTVVALGLYFCVKLLISALTQRFPIMLLGYGVSPIIGYFVAIIWLDTVRRRFSVN